MDRLAHWQTAVPVERTKLIGWSASAFDG